MCELISRQSAIDAVNGMPDCPNGYSDTYDKRHIIAVLEDVPSVQPEKMQLSTEKMQLSKEDATKCTTFDCISRQAAIDTLDVGAEVLRRVLDETDIVGTEREKYKWGLRLFEACISDMEELPSAQPEIIRCKDCKNSEHWYGDRRRCFLWSEDGVSVFDDGFCNYAERRRDG